MTVLMILVYPIWSWLMTAAWRIRRYGDCFWGHEQCSGTLACYPTHQLYCNLFVWFLPIIQSMMVTFQITPHGVKRSPHSSLTLRTMAHNAWRLSLFQRPYMVFMAETQNTGKFVQYKSIQRVCRVSHRCNEGFCMIYHPDCSSRRWSQTHSLDRIHNIRKCFIQLRPALCLLHWHDGCLSQQWTCWFEWDGEHRYIFRCTGFVRRGNVFSWQHSMLKNLTPDRIAQIHCRCNRKPLLCRLNCTVCFPQSHPGLAVETLCHEPSLYCAESSVWRRSLHSGQRHCDQHMQFLAAIGTRARFSVPCRIHIATFSCCSFLGGLYIYWLCWKP